MGHKAIEKRISFHHFLFPACILLMFGMLLVFRQEISFFLHDSDRFANWLLSHRTWAVLLFILAQTFQVVVFVIPGEVVQIAGGYVFGTLMASIYSYIGVLLAASICFYISQFSGKGFVAFLVGRKRFSRFESMLSNKRSLSIFFLFFLIPGFPKDVLYYLGGLSRIPFLLFITASSIARLPGIVGSSIMGSLLYQRSWLALILLAGLALISGLVIAIYHNRLSSWIDRLLSKHGSEKGDRPETGAG